MLVGVGGRRDKSRDFRSGTRKPARQRWGQPHRHLPGGARSEQRRDRRRFGGRGLGAGRQQLGQLRVQRRRRNPLGGLGLTDDHPVAARILDQVGGVLRRDHAEFTGRVGQGGCRLGLEDVALEGFLLLGERIVEFTGVAQLVGPLGGIGGQPQRYCQSDRQGSDDQHHKRNPRQQRLGPQFESRECGQQPLPQRRPDYFGRLGLTCLGSRLGLAGGLGAGRAIGGPRGRCRLRARTGTAWLMGTPGPGTGSRAAVACRAVTGATCARRAVRTASADRRGGVRRGLLPGIPRATGRLSGNLHPMSSPCARSMARSRTGALRGLRPISPASGRSAPRVSVPNSGP